MCTACNNGRSFKLLDDTGFKLIIDLTMGAIGGGKQYTTKMRIFFFLFQDENFKYLKKKSKQILNVYCCKNYYLPV